MTAFVRTGDVGKTSLVGGGGGGGTNKFHSLTETEFLLKPR